MLRRVLSGVAVLLCVTYVSFLTQGLAMRSRSNQLAPVGEVATQEFGAAVGMLRRLSHGELGLYKRPIGYWSSSEGQPLKDLLGGLLLNSAALLVLAMILGGFIGGLIGVVSAAARRPGASLGLLLFSIVGISTPSFFLGAALQCLEITIYRSTGVRLVPVGGFGWDSHLVLPVLVLAARPIAQVARLSHVTITDILDDDYVRTARAKGLPRRAVWAIHVIPNAASSVLTAMVTSLRFSLSSLPLVEVLFGWPGAGKAMLDMLRTFQRTGATTLILVMGALFVALNILLDLVYRALDPRVPDSDTHLRAQDSLWEWTVSLLEELWATITLRRWRQRRVASAGSDLAPLSELAAQRAMASGDSDAKHEAAVQLKARRSAWLHAAKGNPALWLGALVVAGLLAAVAFGPSLVSSERTTPTPMVTLEGRQIMPPVAPCATYPLGTDSQGRDILGLILVGARRTLTMALFAVSARLAVGTTLGFLAGWFAGSRLDRAIMGLAEVLSAFPALLLAMLIVYAIGVRQGLIAFVVALSAIGWGEVMQTVRTQVAAIKPMAYIEGAVATGAGGVRILTAHVLPNVWPTLVSLAFLEMGGVLMILGELGFLGVFIGGGLASEDAKGLPVTIYYDVPEWSVMLANSWRAFRSFPWATFYPALAFFAAILGFTSLGEGMRRLSERLTLSFRSVFSRYTLCAAVLVILGARWMFDSTSLYAVHERDAASFDVGRALEDVRYLASDAFNGRLSGTDDAHRVAGWIAAEFEELGLQPAGSDGHLQFVTDYYRDLTGVPSLVLRGPDGQELRGQYGIDFARPSGPADAGGWAKGDVVLVDQDPVRWWWPARQVAFHFGISMAELERSDRIIMGLSTSFGLAPRAMGFCGRLMVSPDAALEGRYQLLTRADRPVSEARPELLISPDLASRIIEESGHALDALQREAAGAEAPGLFFPTGWTAEIDIPARQARVQSRNVIAIWPGEDVVMDAEAIVVAAYYDGLGVSPDGTLYPGANDNASGVAAMLETIRTLKNQGFRPKRTMIFVAWEGGDRRRAVDYEQYLRAHLGFAEAYEIVAGFELEGVGAGTGASALMQHCTRAQLTEVIQRAARRVGTPLTMRGQGLHPDPDIWPVPSTDVPSATISWLGSHDLAHLPSDTADSIDPEKLAEVGRMVSLALMVLTNDPSFQ